MERLQEIIGLTVIFAGVVVASALTIADWLAIRRERVSAGQRVEASRAAFDEFVNSPIGGVV